MTDILSALIAWVEWVITEAGYPGLVLAMLLETVFPPIPSEAILPFAGVLTRRGVFDLWGVVTAATIGSVAGAGLLYALGRWVEDHILIRAVRRYGRWIGLTEAALERALNAFERHGWAAVFLGRLLPGLRSFISIPAGMCGAPGCPAKAAGRSWKSWWAASPRSKSTRRTRPGRCSSSSATRAARRSTSVCGSGANRAASTSVCCRDSTSSPWS